MFSTPRKQHGGKYSGTPKKVPLNGLFQDGIWNCNCQPRLPASHFLVRKEGPNKGRWFYTCQEPKEKGCGFFLWDDDASSREMRAVINNSRSEVAPASDVTTSRGGDMMTVQGHIEASNKFMVDLGRDDNEEFGDWSLSKEDEQEVSKAADSASYLTSYPETPRKAARLNEFSTPGSKRKMDESAEAYPTPVTGRSDIKDIFATPARLKGGMFDGNEKSGLLSPSTTPMPGRFRHGDLIKVNKAPTSDLQDYDITQEVMEIIKDQSINEETTIELKRALNRHALKTQGIARGRDITRAALKSKEVKIAELQQRITELETERDLDKVIIKHFKSDMAGSVSRRSRGSRGRGRGS